MLVVQSSVSIVCGYRQLKSSGEYSFDSLVLSMSNVFSNEHIYAKKN